MKKTKINYSEGLNRIGLVVGKTIFILGCIWAAIGIPALLTSGNGTFWSGLAIAIFGWLIQKACKGLVFILDGFFK